MTPELEALARRAKACPRFRWAEGMLTTCRVRVVEGDRDYIIGVRQGATIDGGGWIDDVDESKYLPDLSDYATIGCLLGIYDQTRKRRICPDPVYTYAAAYGLTHPKTIEALVTELENTP